MNLLELCFKPSRGSLRSSRALFSVGCGTVVEVVSQTSVILNTRTAVNLNYRTGLEVTLSDVTTVDSVCYQVLPISFTPNLCITLWATSLWRSPCWAPNHVTGSDVTQLVMMLSSIFLAVVIESKWHNRYDPTLHHFKPVAEEIAARRHALFLINHVTCFHAYFYMILHPAKECVCTLHRDWQLKLYRTEQWGAGIERSHVTSNW